MPERDDAPTEDSPLAPSAPPALPLNAAPPARPPAVKTLLEQAADQVAAQQNDTPGSSTQAMPAPTNTVSEVTTRLPGGVGRPAPPLPLPGGSRRPVPAAPIPTPRRPGATPLPSPASPGSTSAQTVSDAATAPTVGQTVATPTDAPRVTLTGEPLLPQDSAPPLTPISPAAGVAANQPGMVEGVQIGSVIAPPVPPPLGTDAANTATTSMPAAAPPRRAVRRDDEEEDDSTSDMALLLRYAGVLAALLVGAGIFTALAPGLFYVPLLIVNFVGGLLLPILRVGPWRNDDGEDSGWFALLTIVFGPIITLVIYGVLGVVRQGFNPSVMGCCLVAALARVGLALIVGHGHFVFADLTPFSQQAGFNFFKLLVNWAGMLALVGWFVADVFHKFDE